MAFAFVCPACLCGQSRPLAKMECATRIPNEHMTSKAMRSDGVSRVLYRLIASSPAAGANLGVGPCVGLGVVPGSGQGPAYQAAAMADAAACWRS